MLSYKDLEHFFKSTSPSKKHFRISYTVDNKLFTYNVSQFREWGDWYVEKADHKNIILSLKKYVLNRRSNLIFHITIYPSTWNSSYEFHITVGMLNKTEIGNVVNIICSTFYQLTDKSYKQVKPADNYRPSCIHRADLDKISNEHAENFKKFISLYLQAKSTVGA